MNITNTTQLNTFSTIRTILNNNSTIAGKFSVSDYYEFTPNLKALGVSIPYIVIEPPTTPGTEFVTLDNATRDKPFIVNIEFVFDYHAKSVTDNHDLSNIRSYLNQAVVDLEGAASTFNAAGYYHPKAEVGDIAPEYRHQKQVIVGVVELDLKGFV